MIEYLKKFNSLPKDIRTKMSSASKMKLIDSLEQKHGINLAAFVMRVMIADIAYNKQTAALMRELGLSQDKAKEVVRDLKTQIFAEVSSYLQDKKDFKFFPKAKTKSLPAKIGIDHLISAHNEKISEPETQDLSKQNNTEAEELADKQELGEFSKIVADIKKDLPIDETLEVTINQIIKEIKLSFSSEALAKRFKQSLSFYLKGAKSRVNTREFFLKEVSKGGLNFEPILADRVLRVADTKLNRKQATGKINIKSRPDGTTFIFNDQEINKEKLNQVAANNSDYDLATAIAQRKTQNIDSEKSPKPSPVTNLKDVKVANQLPEESKKDLQKEEVKKDFKDNNTFTKDSVLGKGSEVSPAPTSQPRKRIIPDSGKNKMHDIKPASRSMNPIDELRYMDLVAFRRIAPDIKAITAKIKKNIDLISEQGLSKRLEAINAWKNSPVNNIYLQIGKQSISQGLSVEEVIALRKEEGKDILSINEFEEISDLNNSLRF